MTNLHHLWPLYLVYGLVALMVTMILVLSYVFWPIPYVGPMMSISMIGLAFYWLDKVKHPPKKNIGSAAFPWYVDEEILTWKQARAEFSIPYRSDVGELGSFEFPDPLYESLAFNQSKRICLVCGNKHGYSALRTVSKEIVPMCQHCRIDWNFYGYEILKRLKPKKLLWRVFKFKLFHWLSTQSIFACYQDLCHFQHYAYTQKRILRAITKE